MVVRGTSQRSVRTAECHYGGALDDHAQVAVELRVNFNFIAQLRVRIVARSMLNGPLFTPSIDVDAQGSLIIIILSRPVDPIHYQ